MFRSLIVLLFLLFSAPSAFAGLGEPITDARASSLGYSSTLLGGAYAIFHNPAMLIGSPGATVGISVGNKFLISDIKAYGVAAVVPTGSGSFGVGIYQEGIPSFKESHLALGYGRLITDGLSIGAEFDVFNVNIENHGSTTNFTFGIGMKYEINNRITVGAHLFNPLNGSFSDSDFDRIPASIRIGLMYAPSEKVRVLLEAEKNSLFPAHFKGGLEYNILPAFVVRGGFSTAPASFHFGFGLKTQNLLIDFSDSFHPTLGHTPQITVAFQANPRKSKEN